MERARATWTDERLDDRFDSLEGRIDTLQPAMLQVGGGMTAAILATLVSVIVTQA